MLSSRIDEIVGKLAHFLEPHIHNTSPRHSRRRRYHNTLVTLRPMLSLQPSQARINRRRILSSPDSRKPNTKLTRTRHMLRCTPNRNRTSRTMPRRTMMATTAMAECPCPRHTRPSAGNLNSETTNSRLLEPNTNRGRGTSATNNASFRMHTWRRSQPSEIAHSLCTCVFLRVGAKVPSIDRKAHCLDAAKSRQAAQPGHDANHEEACSVFV